MLPDDSRRSTPAPPVIFLSAKGDIVDKATGFGQGGDDYITKPFARQELVMRIEAVLRRAMPASYIGADSLHYLSMEGILKAVEWSGCGFCTACLNGAYPMGVPNYNNVKEVLE